MYLDGKRTRILKGDILIWEKPNIRVLRPMKDGSSEILEWDNDEHGTSTSIWCEHALPGVGSFRMLAIIMADAVGLKVVEHRGRHPSYKFV